MRTHFLSFAVVALMVTTSCFARTVYLIGDATSSAWTLEEALVMDSVAENIYEWEGYLYDGELKFLLQHDWVPSYGPQENGDTLKAGLHDLALRETYDDPDNKFLVKAGRYFLGLDFSGENVVLTVERIYPEALYIIGPAVGGWSWDDNAQEMMNEGNGIYIWTGTLSEGELKFFEEKDFSSTAYGASEAGQALIEEGKYDLEKLGEEDKKFIASAAEVTLFVDLNQMKLTLSHETALPEAVEAEGTVLIYDLSGARRTYMEKGQVYILKNGTQITKIFIQ
jgi:hypothetical protein